LAKGLKLPFEVVCLKTQMAANRSLSGENTGSNAFGSQSKKIKLRIMFKTLSS